MYSSLILQLFVSTLLLSDLKIYVDRQALHFQNHISLKDIA